MFDIAVRPVTGIEIININRQRSQFIQTVQVILLAGIVFGQLADDRKIELINQLMTIQIQQRAAVIGNRVTARFRVPTLVSADDVTAQLLLRTPRSGIFAPPRLSGSYQQTLLCWGVASTCSRWAEKAGSASYFQVPLM